MRALAIAESSTHRRALGLEKGQELENLSVDAGGGYWSVVSAKSWLPPGNRWRSA